MNTKLTIFAIAAVSLAVAQTSFAAGAKDEQGTRYGLAEVMANSVALQAINQCSGRGKEVLDACSEVSLATNLHRVEKAIDPSVLGSVPKDEFVAQVYSRAKRALAAMKQAD